MNAKINKKHYVFGLKLIKELYGSAFAYMIREERKIKRYKK